VNLTRRILLGGAIAAPVAALWASKPAQHGAGGHDEYFRGLQQALRDAELLRPTLVIDREKLDHNIARLRQHLPVNKHYRIVAKSLPSLDLIRHVRAATGTDRLMCFHQPFLNLIAREMTDAQVLMGKPMPVVTAHRFFEHFDGGDFKPAQQLQWLVDTPERLAQYRELAQAQFRDDGRTMRVNLELDVGLHRGGLRSAQTAAEMIQVLRDEPAMEFSGFMGYEAHASKMPELLGGPTAALKRAMAFYSECVASAREVLGSEFDEARLTLNSGGSSTYELYDETAPCNELAMGSGLVKPSDFDRPTLADHVPACFIATPVLKTLDRTEISGLESLSGAMRAWDPNTARAFYLYGGYWYADPVSPPGLQRNAIWGHSTNQELWNGSAQVELAVDDVVFFRPHQSESVFLQFGDVAVYSGGKIESAWPVFVSGA
jgi:D-serine deaminase-like pyridoxal phosphate-dependent protein